MNALRIFLDYRINSGGRSRPAHRDGRTAEASRDRFADLINVPVLTPLSALLGLLIAAGLGALHAFSPGHGKTVVGAYLVGSKGTARHAAFLGLTVTITHTAGVFALGMITLFASQYIVPERIFPVLSFISGAIVLVIGLTLFIRRLRIARGAGAHTHAHGTHSHDVSVTPLTIMRRRIVYSCAWRGGAFAFASGSGRQRCHLAQPSCTWYFRWTLALSVSACGLAFGHRASSSRLRAFAGGRVQRRTGRYLNGHRVDVRFRRSFL
jgi:ABC-type nickel/cobalt efflux system permease component RcnA